MGCVDVPAILTNSELTEDYNRRTPLLVPRLLELSKSVKGADNQIDYVCERIQDYFVNGSKQLTTDKARGFIDVSRTKIQISFNLRLYCRPIQLIVLVPVGLLSLL